MPAMLCIIQNHLLGRNAVVCLQSCAVRERYAVPRERYAVSSVQQICLHTMLQGKIRHHVQES